MNLWLIIAVMSYLSLSQCLSYHSYLTRLGLTAVSRKKKFPEIHVINPFDEVCWVKMAGYWLRILSAVYGP